MAIKVREVERGRSVRRIVRDPFERGREVGPASAGRLEVEQIARLEFMDGGDLRVSTKHRQAVDCAVIGDRLQFGSEGIERGLID